MFCAARLYHAHVLRVAVLALVVAGCGPAPAPLKAERPSPVETPVDRAAELVVWKTRLDPDRPLDKPIDELLPEVEAMLASPDPERRDVIAFELLSRWLRTEGAIDDETVAALRDRLVARTAAEPPARADDSVYVRSFAALGLSVVAAREVAKPVATWDDATLEAQVAAAVAYAGRERDLRGHTGAGGWAHAAAHTADWLKFLARHPALTEAQAVRVLDAITSLVARRHGARFSHGEDERLAAAARAVLRRGLVDDATVDAWLARVAAPLGTPWPVPFDRALYAAQRNARDLLVSLFVALSFDDAPPAAAALARLRAFMAR
jgi:hypothetical protein